MAVFQPGDRIGPHYIVESALGEGAMAVVYRCRHAVLGCMRAVKVLNEDLSRDKNHRTRFLQEAGMQAQLRHPHIMEVVDFVDQGLLVAHSMPCATGFEGDISLADRLDRGRLDPKTALAWFRQLAAALEYAHAAGVVHRDVKPANVLLETDHEGRAALKLMDFGVAKVLQGPARSHGGKPMGTYEYMAPEQIQDPLGVGPASDQYAASCVLYELLCGRRPFDRGEGETDFSLMRRVVDDPVDERPLARVPAEVREVVRRGLAKAPGARFAGMREMVGALEEALARGQARAHDEASGRERAEEGARVRAQAALERAAASKPSAGGGSAAAGASGHGGRTVLLGGLALLLAVGAVVSWLALRPGGRGRGVEAPSPEQPKSPPPAVVAHPPPPGPPVPELDVRGIEWVPLPGGTFQMGSNEGDSDEKPVHEVRVGAFSLMKSEITVAMYKACVEAGRCKPAEKCTWETPNWGKSGVDDHPVNCIDWEEARGFCAWAGGRLPSEAEWEYAASGGEGRKYPWGEAEATCDRAVMRGCPGETQPACSKPKGNSKHGICDLAGNVWEWVEDCYHVSYTGAPQDGTAWTPWIQGSGSNRVHRGGGWFDPAAYLRAAYRGRNDPGFRLGNLGGRCARSG